MNSRTYTLFWAQWHPVAWALGGIWVFILGSFLSLEVWNGLHEYGQLYGVFSELMPPFAGFLWFVGMVLIFTERNAAGMQFHTPSRYATLPLSTSRMVGTLLFSRVALTLLHTSICSLCMGLDSYDAYLSRSAMIMLAVNGAIYLQWAAFLMNRQSVPHAIAKTLTFYAVLSVVGAYLAPSNLSELMTTLFSGVIVGIPALVLCIRDGYDARHGNRVAARGKGPTVPASRHPNSTKFSVLAHLPSHPIWTQTWLEFRSATVWFPIGLVSISIVGLGIPALTISNHLDIWELQSISYAGIGTAFVVGYLWERRNSVNTRFRIPIPMSDTHLSIARSLACLIAITFGLIGIAVTIALLLLLRSALGHTMLTIDDLLILSFRTLSEIGLWWIALTVGRLLIVTSFASSVWFILISALFWEFSSDNEQYLIVSLLTVLQLSLTVLAFHAQRHYRGANPYFWLVPIILLPVSVLEEFLGPIYVGTMYLNAADLTLFTLYPISLACLTLYYAWASGIMTLRLGACLIVGGLVSVPLVNFLDVLSSYPRAPYYESETTLYVAFALMLPFLWFPLLNRIHRYG